MLAKDHRLYIAVSAELPLGLAAAQAVHAAFQFSRHRPDLVDPWLRDSSYLVIVTVADEDALIALAGRALDRGIAIETWHEPDRGDETTAVALQPGVVARRLCGNLPLLGRQVDLALTG